MSIPGRRTSVYAHRNHWNFLIDYVVLEECSDDEAFCVERKWIEVFAESGLENLSARRLADRERDELIAVVAELGVAAVARKVHLPAPTLEKAMSGKSMWNGSICMIRYWLREGYLNPDYDITAEDPLCRDRGQP